MSIIWEPQDLFVSSIGATVHSGSTIFQQGCSLKVGRFPAAGGIRELLIRKGIGGKIGITVRLMERGKLLILAVAKRSPAYMAGLRFGDEILSLNDEISTGNMATVRELLQRSKKNSVKLRTKDRSGERYVVIARDTHRGYGFRFMNGEISFVRSNTSAERSGLERRLQIIEVNGEVVAGMSDEVIEAIICANPHTVTLCVIPTKIYRNSLARLMISSEYEPSTFIEM